MIGDCASPRPKAGARRRVSEERVRSTMGRGRGWRGPRCDDNASLFP